MLDNTALLYSLEYRSREKNATAFAQLGRYERELCAPVRTLRTLLMSLTSLTESGVAFKNRISSVPKSPEPLPAAPTIEVSRNATC